MALHDTKELHDDLRRRKDEHLTLSPALCVDDVVLASQMRGSPWKKTKDGINVRDSHSENLSVRIQVRISGELTRTDTRTMAASLLFAERDGTKRQQEQA